MKIGLVGIGKIARDQHLPALEHSDEFELAATASRHGKVEGIDSYVSVEAMLAARPDIEAVSICTPPEGRFDQAARVLIAGRHLMLEKPPAATVSEVEVLHRLAREHRVSLFATWHSREAAQVEPARNWLAGRHVRAARIRWKEDIRQWHPGQDWILASGGFGVFDPGINALSILTHVLPDAIAATAASFSVPANCASPIAATMSLRAGVAQIDAQFDFLQTGQQTWDIEVETDLGLLRLRNGGSILDLPGQPPRSGSNEEYPRLYRQFAALIREGRSDVDLRPLQLVADAYLIAERHAVEAFTF